MPSARFEYASAKIRIVRISAIDVRGMIDDGRCVSSAACEIDSRPTNEMIASEIPFIKLNGFGQPVSIECTSSPGSKAKRKPKKRIDVSLTTSRGADEPLKRGALANAAHVEVREADDQAQDHDEVHRRARRRREPRDQIAEVADAAPGEERDVDREVEQHGPAGHEAQQIAEPAHDEVLSAAGDRIGGGEFGVGEADADVDEAGEQERDVRSAGGGAEDETQRDEDVGADVGVTPGVRAPRRDRSP